jgi:hypothetical protein
VPLTATPHGAGRRRTNVYVAIEGQVTEREYLAFLNSRYGDSHRFKVHPLWQRNGLTTATAVVAKAVDRIEKDSPGWALFDMDEKTDLVPALKLAEREGVNVALSHPAFEVWLYLHFGDASGPFGDRVRMVRKLRQAHPAYASYDRDGTGKHLSGHRLNALLEGDRLVVAAARARRLERRCEDGDCDHPVTRAGSCPWERRDPSTGVYRLLVELGVT